MHETLMTKTFPQKSSEATKNYRILISSCWNTDIRLFDFYSKRGLGPNQSH